MATTIRELLVKLNFDADEKKIKSFTQKIDKAKAGLYNVAKAAAAAGASIAGAAGLKLKAMHDTAQYATEIERLQKD